MKIAVYLSGVPRKSKNEFKRDILTRFAHGAKLAGDEVYLVTQDEPVECDVAVLQGWIGMKTGAHLEVRRRVIKQQRRSNQHTLAMDSNLFGFLEPADFNRYLRYSLDDVFPDTGYYFDHDPDPQRWQRIKARYGFAERGWSNNGSNILVALQRNGGWSMGDVPVQQWLDTLLPQIRQHTDRPIVIRPHPGNLAIVPTIQLPPVDQVTWSTRQDIREDLNQTWATVTYNSSPGVASILWGVPAFVTDPRPAKSQAWPWASDNIAEIESPRRDDRQEFYTKLAQCHWSSEEISSGEAWRFMRQRLPKIPCQ
jgi:hypothetical protein